MTKLSDAKLNYTCNAVCLALFLGSLSIPLISSADVQVAEKSAVENCQYVDKVEGSSGYGKNLNWQSLAKHYALSRAEKLGASHLVWDQFYPVGAFNGIATGKAYNCKS